MPEGFEGWSTLGQSLYFLLYTILIAPAMYLWKVYSKRRHKKSVSSLLDYVNEKFPDESNATPLVARSMTCVIVDDKPGDFPVEFMKGFFKDTDVRSSVSLSEAGKLARYDFIFLDVAGVVSEDMEFGGATLIDDIRREGCKNTIISVSSKKYDMRVNNYFAKADIRIRKPLRVEDIRQQVFSHIEHKIGPHALAKKIDNDFKRLYGERQLKKLASSLPESGGGAFGEKLKRAAIGGEYKALVELLERMDA